MEGQIEIFREKNKTGRSISLPINKVKLDLAKEGVKNMNEAEIRSGRRKLDTMDIERDFSDYDRVFFQQGDINNYDALWMFSEKNQMIMRMDLATKKMEKVDVLGGRKYGQVEVYDKKIFCIDGKELIMDIFFLSKKQQSY